jgi:hypothetical protein
MTKIPHAQTVRQSLRAVRAAAKNARKGLNKVASERMSKGDYVSAETLATKGKEIIQFESEVDALLKRWRDLCGGANRAENKAVTPLWNYYQPILQALHNMGGSAHRNDLERQVEQIMGPTFLPGDRKAVSRGRERWQLVLRRARKPMTSEGWIERGGGPTWKITSAGRQAAQKSPADRGLQDTGSTA